MATDPENCGRCGRSCAGGACRAGTCEAVILTSTASNPCRIAVDDSGIYWANANDGTIVVMPHAGGTPTVLADGQDHPFDIALDATNVYWTTHTLTGTVARVPKAGGMVSVLATDQRRPRALALTNDEIWVANFDASEIVSLPIDGRPVMQRAMSAGVAALAIAGADVYYWDRGALALTRLSTDGGDPTAVAPLECRGALSCIGEITTDGTDAYVGFGGVDPTMGRVVEVALDADPPTVRVVADAQFSPTDLVIDDTNVYWVTLGTSAAAFNDGEVWMAPRAGGDAVRLVADQPRPCGLALHDGSLYWTRGGDDRVSRLVVD